MVGENTTCKGTACTLKKVVIPRKWFGLLTIKDFSLQMCLWSFTIITRNVCIWKVFLAMFAPRCRAMLHRALKNYDQADTS